MQRHKRNFAIPFVHCGRFSIGLSNINGGRCFAKAYRAITKTVKLYRIFNNHLFIKYDTL